MTVYEQYGEQNNRKWIYKIVKTNIVTATVVIMFEVFYYFILSAMNLRTQTEIEYVLQFIVLPAVLILFSCTCGYLAVYKSKFSDSNKALASILAMVGICCTAATIHNIFAAAAYSFFVPLSISVVFGKKRITNIVGAVSVVGTIVSMIFANGDLRGQSSYFLPDCLMFFIVFGILWYSSILLMQNEQEKRALINNMLHEQNMLQRKVCRDELTGLYNLLGLQLFVDEKMSESDPNNPDSSIAFLDIDDFKSVNDTYGHEAGNVALNFTAHTISSLVPQNCCVARYGGDEFVVLLPGISTDESKTIFDIVLAKIGEARLAELKGSTLTLSCGVARYQSDIPVLEAVHASDVAMYKAKTGGKNCTVVA